MPRCAACNGSTCSPILRAAIRGTDFVGRVGGGEFLVVLPETDASQAMGVAETIRDVVASNPIDPVGQVTVSIGVEQVRQGDVNEAMAVNRADDALYRAKAAGRNRVMAGAPAGQTAG
ncbi:GGDEF domain-containing protein [Cupriavidus sp. AU9028]|nr:GGDEF domain-containing protein [Cupriavidus sp. AU9028]